MGIVLGDAENRHIQSFKYENVFAKLAANGLKRLSFWGDVNRKYNAVMSQ